MQVNCFVKWKFVASHDGEVCPAKWKKGESTLKPSIDLVGKI